MISEQYVKKVAGLMGSTISESASGFKIVDDSKMRDDLSGSFTGEIMFDGPTGEYVFEFHFPNGRMHGEDIGSWDLFKVTNGKSVKIGSNSTRNMSAEAEAASQFAYDYVDSKV